ncbi:MAG: hypothetical protein CMM49_05215 [Rhodospirillaceae bacterium]|nr:hypothetical protein [Rhodospirillaceae bacterium]|tara:strand:+ start:237 stop:1964 length:1728 start_codon:yes stop_codon:yes gene_type:complete
MKNNNYILGIHDGHNCGASLCIDGKIISSVLEERITRKKNEVGYPKNSIEACLRIANIDATSIAKVVIASNFMHHPSYLTDVSSWYLVGKNEQKLDKKISKDYLKSVFVQRRDARIKNVVKHLEINPANISFIEHHLAHLAAAYYTSPKLKKDKKFLGITCDGAGDGLSATVSICDNNNFNRISSTDRHASLGKIYSRITMLLGMKPWEHEYKIMGLAPYADQKIAYNEARKFHYLLKLNKKKLKFELNNNLSTAYSYFYFKEQFERIRFDNIAGAVQLFTEDMLVKWVKAAIKKTKISDIVCGGGVFMNVKANMLIQNLPEVNSMYVMPSASDESLSIGAALHYYNNNFNKDFLKNNGSMTDLYLGEPIYHKDLKATLNKIKKNTNYIIKENYDFDNTISNILHKGEPISICNGRTEWGARALCNRSIIARAGSKDIVERINSQIKMRDFWMPFAPTILDTKYKSCIEDKKNIKPMFMTFALPAQKKAQNKLAGAMHPVDKTCRPQVLKKSTNKKIYNMLKNYCNKYKEYGVLQTSFNIHGEPIVNSAGDALSTLQRSGLKHLVLENYLISKKT